LSVKPEESKDFEARYMRDHCTF